MTVEEVFCNLYDKYGKDFTWHMIPLSQSKGTLVEELKNEELCQMLRSISAMFKLSMSFVLRE